MMDINTMWNAFPSIKVIEYAPVAGAAIAGAGTVMAVLPAGLGLVLAAPAAMTGGGVYAFGKGVYNFYHAKINSRDMETKNLIQTVVSTTLGTVTGQVAKNLMNDTNTATTVIVEEALPVIESILDTNTTTVIVDKVLPVIESILDTNTTTVIDTIAANMTCPIMPVMEEIADNTVTNTVMPINETMKAFASSHPILLASMAYNTYQAVKNGHSAVGAMADTVVRGYVIPGFVSAGVSALFEAKGLNQDNQTNQANQTMNIVAQITAQVLYQKTKKTVNFAYDFYKSKQKTAIRNEMHAVLNTIVSEGKQRLLDEKAQTDQGPNGCHVSTDINGYVPTQVAMIESRELEAKNSENNIKQTPSVPVGFSESFLATASVNAKKENLLQVIAAANEPPKKEARIVGKLALAS